MDAKLEQAQEMMQEAEERHKREKEYVFILLVGVHMQFISFRGSLGTLSDDRRSLHSHKNPCIYGEVNGLAQ